MRTVSYQYDTAGFVEAVTNPESQTHEFGYDGIGQLTSATRPDNEVIAFAYQFRDLVGTTPPGQPQHQLTYDGVRQLTSYKPPVVGTPEFTTYGYDDDHSLVEIDRPDGRFVVFEYDEDTGNLDMLTIDRGDCGPLSAPTWCGWRNARGSRFRGWRISPGSTGRASVDACTGTPR